MYLYKFRRALLCLVLTLILSSCNKQFKDNDFTAYFGGEIINPTNPYVLFYKDSELIDTIPLNPDHTFLVKFDSLTPGLYSFKHEPEYQYVYFDKNDSIMVRVNIKEFDQSVTFCGRGDEKNNFLMELYLKNEEDRNKIFNVLDYNLTDFTKNIDSAYNSKLSFYNTKKNEIKWSEEFDLYAKGTLDFFQYSKKEIYPMVHKMRTGEDICKSLPKDFYNYRHHIDYNNSRFTNFSPFVKYLTNMLNNIAIDCEATAKKIDPNDASLDLNLKKLNIADTLFKDEKIKNVILKNIAFSYLLEDQHIVNNKKFLDHYHKISTDKSQNEISKIGNAIQLLKVGNTLPELRLIDLEGKKTLTNTITKNKKTIIFFWTENLETHFIAAHKKIVELQKKYPSYNFIAINVDQNFQKWKQLLANYKFTTIQQYQAANFQELKDKWVINKIHRTIILNSNGTINNAFVNLFDSQFEAKIK